MKIICTKENLNHYVQIVQKAVAKQNVLPILSGIHIQAKIDQVILTAKNSEMEIQCLIPADIQEQGSFVIEARYFSDIVRKLPNADVVIETKGKQMIIKCERSIFKLNGYDETEFPMAIHISEEKTLSVKQGLFKNLIKQTIFATAANDEARPYLTGINMIVKNKNLTFVSTDGHRLAYRTIEIEDINRDYEINIIIPGKTLNELIKILEDNEEILEIVFTEKQIGFYIKNIKITSQLLEGEYIHYEQVIPKGHKIFLEIDTFLFQDAIERASLLSKDNYNKIILKISEEGKLIIYSDHSEIGRVEEEIPAEIEGKELHIAFNSRYLLDILRVIDSEKIKFNLIADNNPGVICPCDYEGYTYVIMPVRLS